ncbi:MAG: metallophosphoesterase family protein [Hyphomicrobiaceae bacterium]
MPSVPDGERIYAIGDLHGRDDLLARMLARIATDDAGRAAVDVRRIILIGDYVDRGPSSFGVIERLTRHWPDGFTPTFLKGNHEVMMIDAIDEVDRDAMLLWLLNGGQSTIDSYQAAADAAAGEPMPMRGEMPMPRHHWQFLMGLQLKAVHGDYMFVHAGIRPGVPVEEQVERDLVWIREPFLSHSGLLDKIVVHGHTPVDRPDVRRHRIGIDTGAVFSGRLTALRLEGTTREFIEVEAD